MRNSIRRPSKRGDRERLRSRASYQVVSRGTNRERVCIGRHLSEHSQGRAKEAACWRGMV